MNPSLPPISPRSTARRGGGRSSLEDTTWWKQDPTSTGWTHCLAFQRPLPDLQTFSVTSSSNTPSSSCEITHSGTWTVMQAPEGDNLQLELLVKESKQFGFFANKSNGDVLTLIQPEERTFTNLKKDSGITKSPSPPSSPPSTSSPKPTRPLASMRAKHTVITLQLRGHEIQRRAAARGAAEAANSGGRPETTITARALHGTLGLNGEAVGLFSTRDPYASSRLPLHYHREQYEAMRGGASSEDSEESEDKDGS